MTDPSGSNVPRLLRRAGDFAMVPSHKLRFACANGILALIVFVVFFASALQVAGWAIALVKQWWHK